MVLQVTIRDIFLSNRQTAEELMYSIKVALSEVHELDITADQVAVRFENQVPRQEHCYAIRILVDDNDRCLTALPEPATQEKVSFMALAPVALYAQEHLTECRRIELIIREGGEPTFSDTETVHGHADDGSPITLLMN